jgi:hypothetical protein
MDIEKCLYCGHDLPSHCQEGKCKDPCLCTVYKEMTKTTNWIRLYVNRYKDKPNDGLCEICLKRPYYELGNTGAMYNLQTENWQFLCRNCRLKSEYNRGIRKPVKHTPETRERIRIAMLGNTNGF